MHMKEVKNSGIPKPQENEHQKVRNAVAAAGKVGEHPKPIEPKAGRRKIERHYDERPNVLWLMADQWRGDMLGFLGRHPAVKTPNLDRLAAKGVTFIRSYCNYPVCVPSRATMMTSRRVQDIGVWSNQHPMNEEEVCFPKLIEKAGYRTASLGKTHCGRSATDIFEYVDNPKDAFGATVPTDVPFDPDLYPDCMIPEGWDRNNPNNVLHGTYPAPKEVTKSYILASKAISFLHYHTRPKPFFLRVSFDDPHLPVVPPKEYADMYSLEDATPEILADVDKVVKGKSETGRLIADHLSVPDSTTDDDLRLHAIRYMALCTHLDAQIGRILDYLEEVGYAENTLILFNSDHGHKLGELRAISKSATLLEAENWIPTILSWPGKLPEGKQVDALIEGIDLAPTFLDALNIPTPETMQGRSFLPVAKRERVKIRDYAVIQWEDFGYAIVDERWKLIHYAGDSPDDGELYDLENDPWEKVNLWNDESASEARGRLWAELEAWKREHAKHHLSLNQDGAAEVLESQGL